MRAALLRAWRSYEHLLQTAPLRTQATTTSLLWMLGDGIAQKQVEGRQRLDLKRLFATGAYAGAVVGPVGHGWFSVLDKVVQRYYKPATVAFVAAKVVLDEVIFTPIHIAAFFTYLTTVEGGNWEACKEKLRQDYWPTLVTELIIWPPYQAANFAYVPVKHQLLVCNAATVVDSTFLCWARSQDDWVEAIFPDAKRKAESPDASLRIQD